MRHFVNTNTSVSSLNEVLTVTQCPNQWDPEDLDSVLTLRFVEIGPASASIELSHVGVAASDLIGVTEGWTNFYWTPWREYLDVA